MILPPVLDAAPTFIALPLIDCLTETHPVVKLFRLCDAGEALTRFCAAAVFAEIRAERGELPDGLLTQLRPEMERPTFGAWKIKLDAARRYLPSDRQPGLATFAAEVSALVGTPSDAAEADLVRVRNLLVHAGALAAASRRKCSRSGCRGWSGPLPASVNGATRSCGIEAPKVADDSAAPTRAARWLPPPPVFPGPRATSGW